MKFIIIDDEHELYKRMFADCFKENEYDIEEISRMVIPSFAKPLYKVHFNDRINRRIWIPGKMMLWKSCYRLHKYHFDPNEHYFVLFMNGSLRYHFSKKYLIKIKKNYPNVKLVMIMYDSFSNPTAKRAIGMIPIFDYVFSFDQADCDKYGFEHIYSTFSKPDFVRSDKNKKTKAFFVGFGLGRLKLLQSTFERITNEVSGCKFYIAGVNKKEQKEIKDVVYNVTMPYEEELQMSYNTECIVEIVKEGQTGISLRTCEAIAFNKKLLTNNGALTNMPFYDPRFMQVFETPRNIDIEFIQQKLNVSYKDTDFFSPLKILERLLTLDK